jgi:hypothetical protein
MSNSGSFGMGNGNMNSMGNLSNNSGSGNQNGGYGIELDGKSSTQVTIPKDVSRTKIQNHVV